MEKNLKTGLSSGPEECIRTLPMGPERGRSTIDRGCELDVQGSGSPSGCG